MSKKKFNPKSLPFKSKLAKRGGKGHHSGRPRHEKFWRMNHNGT